MNVPDWCVSALIVTITCVTGVIASEETRNAVPVDGDRDFLGVVSAAVKTARTRFPQGRLSATVSNRSTRVVIHELSWLGDKRYVEFETYDFDSSSRRGEARKQPRMISIVNEREILTWLPSHMIVTRYPRHAASLPYEVQITPLDNWFMFQDTSIVLERMIDAEHPKGTVSGFNVERKSERIIVTRENESDGSDMVFEFSLEQAGLPVSYRTKKTERYTGDYEWRKDRNDNIYLAKYSWSRVLRAEDGQPDVPHFEMEITQWDVGTAVPSEKFSFNSLKLPEGTKIETYNVSGAMKHREWKGGRPLTSGEQFKKLGESLRGRGFGRIPKK